MKLSRNLFIGGMNTNVTPELIDSKLYSLARNVVSSSVGNDGSLHTPKGVTSIGSGDYNWRDSGTNVATDWVCNGMFTSNSKKYIYLFMHATTAGVPTGGDYSDRNILLRHTIGFASLGAVMLAGFDEFIQWETPVIAANGLSFRDEEYLFWTNSDGIPYKLEYFAGNGISDDQQYSVVPYSEFIATVSVIQTPPQAPPRIEYLYDPSKNERSSLDGIFSFKYRYHYTNGGVSAFSPTSQMQYDFIIGAASESVDSFMYNSVDIEYVEPNKSVRYIEIAWKSETAWFSIPLIDSQGVNDYTNPHVFRFFKDDVYAAVSELPSDTKYFDNVPLTAGAQEIIKNKVVYGNYVDNYDSVEDFEMFSSPVYTDFSDDTKAIPHHFVIGVNTNHDEELTISLANIITKADIGDTIYFSWVENTYIQEDFYAYGGISWRTQGSIIVDDYNLVLEQIFAEINANSTYNKYNAQGEVDEENPVDAWLDHVVVSDVLRITLHQSAKNQLGQTPPLTEFHHASGSTITPVNGSFPDSDTPDLFYATKFTSGSSFKYGAHHIMGVCYYDQFNRQNDVHTSVDAKAYVKWFFERNEVINEYVGSSNLAWNINSSPPEWATHYQIVYSKNTRTVNFGTYACDRMLVDPEGSGNYRVDMTPLDLYVDKNKNILSTYSYEEGDVITMVGHWDTTELKAVYWDTNLSGRILANNIDTTDGYSYVEISPETYTLFSEYLEDNYGVTWKHRFIFEISNDTSSAIDGLFYETGEVYGIGDSGLPTRYHEGENRSQNEDVSSIVHVTFLQKYSSKIYRTLSGSAQYPNNVVGDSVQIIPMIGGDPQGTITGQITHVDQFYLVIATSEELSFDFSNITYQKQIQTIASATGVSRNGDSFLRTRLYQTTWPTDLLVPVLCETTSGSDDIKMFNNGLGREQIEKRNKVAITREASMIISEPINEDTNFFGSTSFPNTAFDWTDLDNSFGQVDKMVNMNDNLYVFQNSRVGIQQVEKDILTTASGDGSVSITSNVFGNFIPILDGIGLHGVGSGYVQEFEGSLTFLDPMNKSIFNISGKDIKNISTDSIHASFINDSFTKNISCFIPDRKEYLINLDDGVYAYSFLENKWIGIWDIAPDWMVYAYDGYYSMSNGKMFRHEDSENYNDLYDLNGDLVSVPSVVTISANDKKMNNKSYTSVSVIGDNLDLATIKNISTNITVAQDILSMEKHEGVMTSSVGGGYYNDSVVTDHILGVGYAKYVTATTAVYSEMPHYVSVGDNLYQHYSGVNELVGVITDVTDAIITVAVVINAFNDTAVFSIAKPSKLDGSDIKGQYLEMSLEFGNSGGHEYVTAIDLEGSYSELIH